MRTRIGSGARKTREILITRSTGARFSDLVSEGEKIRWRSRARLSASKRKLRVHVGCRAGGAVGTRTREREEAREGEEAGGKKGARNRAGAATQRPINCMKY